MTLRDRAFLEIDVDGTTAVFELRGDLEAAGEIQKQYLLSNRGQYLREAYDIGTDLLPDDVAEADLESRKGYHVDGGAGTFSESLSFQAAPGDQWGDGSSDPNDVDNVTKYDATGSHPLAMKQVFDYVVAQSRTDSSGPARLHYGEWTDGSHSDSAGAFEQPFPVAVIESRVSREADDASVISGSIQLTWTATFPDVDLLGTIEDGLAQLGDMISDF